MKILSKLANLFTSPRETVPPGPKPDEPGTVRDWTMLVYGAGNEADIDYGIRSSIESLGRIGTNQRLAIAAQVASHSQGGEGRRLLFGEPRHSEDCNFVVDQELGKVDMGSGKTLEEFLAWGLQKYPAKHYLVVLQGHGGAHRGVCSDDLSGNHLSPSDLQRAFQVARETAGQPMDVLVQAACAMASAEACQAVEDSVNYIVAAEAIVPARSPNLHTLADRLKFQLEQGGSTPAKTVEAAINSVEWVTAHSVIHAPGLKELTPKIRKLAKQLTETSTPTPTLRQVAQRALHLGGELQGLEPPPAAFRHELDLVSLARQLAKAPEIQDTDLREAAAEVAASVRGPVVKAGWVGDPALRGLQGLSIWAPTAPVKEAQLEEYASTPFARETGWDGVVRRLSQP